MSTVPESKSVTHFVVAIDGPAGAGKSTVSKLLARRLGYVLLDTGAIYRSVALMAQRQGVSWDDEAAVAEVARGLDIQFTPTADGNTVTVAGQDVTAAIRAPDISQGASKVSAIPSVREALLEIQRSVARKSPVVAEGRDVGTVVFPSAGAKFFLTANPEERARRRTEELRLKGQEVRVEVVEAEMAERDARDSGRKVAPLTRAPDAVEIDSTGISPEDVVARMAAIVHARGG